jgi:chromate transporter
MSPPSDPCDDVRPGTSRRRLSELAALFLRLGFTAFGGPAAHVALMRHEVVTRRRWMKDDAFLDLVGATNLIPGPNSTELAIHVGRVRAGTLGLVVAGACFILPAALLTLALAWAYTRWGQLPQAAAVMAGIKPVVVAIVVQAIVTLARSAVKSPALGVLGAACVVASALRGPELAILFGAGALAAIASLPRGAPAFAVAFPAAGASGIALSTSAIFFVFLKIGSVLFGSGYVLVAFLRTELVATRGWLTEGQLLDAVAAGQVTPGPVFTTATFVGWLLGSGPGAIAATLGIFAPAFVLVALSAPLLPRLRASRLTGRFLDGLNVASLALMAVVAFDLGRAAVVDVPTALVAGAAALVLVTLKPNPTWLIAGGAIVGALR